MRAVCDMTLLFVRVRRSDCTHRLLVADAACGRSNVFQEVLLDLAEPLATALKSLSAIFSVDFSSLRSAGNTCDLAHERLLVQKLKPRVRAVGGLRWLVGWFCFLQ